VVIATGHCGAPLIPAPGARLPAHIREVAPSRYRNPGMLPEGGVLVVGASASGVQLAEELRLAGREVTMAVGRHTRLPRRYRGRDIMWWMDQIGALDERADQVPDLERARAQPSLQLVGRPDGRRIDLGTLRDRGVRLLGRLDAVEGSRIRFRDDLAETTQAAERKLERLLARIDAHAAAAGESGPGERPRAFIPDPHPATLDLDREGIRTVIWATGFRRDYSWLHVPVLGRAGEIVHDGGVTPSPGLYVLGLRFLRRRKSNFIDGVGADAEELSEDILDHLQGTGRAAA
jgi:putative flavoprotein involved in K+ transport